MPFACKITVFTPTYNRAYIIEKLYRSLQRQRYRDFEWLVIDDGSRDNTPELFAAWQQEENPFPIRYIRQENGGKCRAINHGLRQARGELFFNVDSDDHLTDDALEQIDRLARELPKGEQYCGFAGNLGTAPDVTPNRLFEGGYFDGTALDRYRNVDGEHAFIFFTDVHRRYLYPEFPGENFMTEAVAWDRMAAEGYRLRFYNEILTIYAYQEGGLTNSGYDLFLKNPRGTALWFRQKAEYLHYPPKAILGMWYGYTCDACTLRSDAEIAEDIGMPRLLVAPMRWVHALVQIIKKLR